MLVPISMTKKGKSFYETTGSDPIVSLFKKSIFVEESNKTAKEDKSNQLNINKTHFVVIRLICVLLFFKVDSPVEPRNWPDYSTKVAVKTGKKAGGTPHEDVAPAAI